MRAARVVAVLFATLAAAGCGRDDGASARRAATPPPVATTFESRCGAIPATAPAVEAVAVAPTLDESRSLSELTTMYGRASPLHRTMGLTQARIAYDSSLRAEGLREGARVCMRVAVVIAVSAAPMTVFIAQEVTRDACLRPAVHAHEMRHVAAHEAYLREVPALLRARLEAHDVGRLRFAADPDVLQQEAAREVGAIVDAFEADDHPRLDALQSAIDTTEEYARVSELCRTTLVPVPSDGVRAAPDRR